MLLPVCEGCVLHLLSFKCVLLFILLTLLSSSFPVREKRKSLYINHVSTIQESVYDKSKREVVEVALRLKNKIVSFDSTLFGSVILL